MIRLLNHICGMNGTLGWKPCPDMPQEMKDRFQDDYDVERAAAIEKRTERSERAKKQKLARASCSSTPTTMQVHHPDPEGSVACTAHREWRASA